MIVDLKNRIVLITGAARGLGRALALAFASECAKVIINYNKSIESAKELLEQIEEYNTDCSIVQADVSKESEVKKLYTYIKRKYGYIDIIINNAGIIADSYVPLMNITNWETVIDTNLKSVFLCCKYFSKLMIPRKSGKILNIASLQGEIGSCGQANYAASKAGIIGFSKSLAKELGFFNISVNSICPGYIGTELNINNLKKYTMAKSKSVLKIDNCIEDFVDFMLFLSSTKINSVSGQVFHLDSRIL